MSLPSVAANEKTRPAGSARTAGATPERMAFWTTGFGDFLSQDGQNSNPHINDTASGAIIGFDYFGRFLILFFGQYQPAYMDPKKRIKKRLKRTSKSTEARF